MLYYDNLYEIVFHRHEMFPCDELVVISGYVGFKPVQRVEELPMKTTVVYGMYGSEGIHKSLRKVLIEEDKRISNLKILCSTMPVHSKIYMWLNKGEVVHSLIGSANFSMNGLDTPYKETLAETTYDTFKPLKLYRDIVFGNSIPCAETVITLTPLQRKKAKKWIDYDPEVCRLPLYIMEKGIFKIPSQSGLNWGMAKILSGSHVNINDAYIPIPADYASHYPRMFPVKRTAPVNFESVYRQDHRHNDTIEVIWDDGTEMVMLLEGTRNGRDENGNPVMYPKQIASSPSKAVLGKYLRARLGVPEGKPITLVDLDRYGRRNISISLQGEGIYYFDFSLNG